MLVIGDFNLNWLTNDSNRPKETCDNLNLITADRGADQTYSEGSLKVNIGRSDCV